MTAADHGAVLRLMATTPGVVVREADAPEAVARYLIRNPGLSFVAMADGECVGCLFGGQDGRRGHLHHLAVHPAHRGRGLAREMVWRCLTALAAQGIAKSHVDVLVSNETGHGFWAHLGWQQRDDITRYSFVTPCRPNA